jgi:adenosine deaminase
MTNTEKIEVLFEKMNRERAFLYSFFNMMPKGGDLHHHFEGSIYAETYADYAVDNDFYYNLDSFSVRGDISRVRDASKWRKVSSHPDVLALKQEFIRKWSVKDFVHEKGGDSSADHFFATFPRFSIASQENLERGLQELKDRAIHQKVYYLETIFSLIETQEIAADDDHYDEVFLQVQANQDVGNLRKHLDQLHGEIVRDIKGIARRHNDCLDQLHQRAVPDSAELIVRYQNFAIRFRTPTRFFVELLASFESASTSDLVVGVNIVFPEQWEISLRDYWLHMQFYRYLEDKYPGVQYALHAGELTSGIVRPEQLGRHIKMALDIANPKRIGHAVDIVYDNDFFNTINKLKQRDVAIEINLTSNEFILGVSHDLHPVNLYRRLGVPMVICTDDEGVLRSGITEQYVLLVHRYAFSYAYVKSLVYNSVHYSSIKDDILKQSLVEKLDREFARFEEEVIQFYADFL